MRPGYKQSTVGGIPSDWDVAQIGDLLTFKNGLNKEKEFFGQGTPIVNYMDVFSHPGLRINNIQGRVTLSSAEIESFDVRKGDVFFTRTSETVGEIGIASVMLDSPKNTVFSGFVLRGRPQNNLMLDEYKKYCFSCSSVRSQIVSTATYTTRALTNGRLLSQVWIALPPEPEQRAIATVLSDVDALLEGLDRLIAKKRDLKQAAMQQLLTGQIRLPGFEGEWVERCVGEFGRVVTGGTPLTTVPSYWGGEHPWITPTDIHDSRDISEGARSLTSSGLAAVTVLPENTVLVTCIASIGKNAILRRRGSCNQQINAVCPSSEYVPEFLYYLFEHNKGKIQARAGTTATPIVSRASFQKLVFRVPSMYREQASIAAVLSEMDDEIDALKQRRAKTAALKQAMMQELLTGRTRLVKSERSKEQAC